MTSLVQGWAQCEGKAGSGSDGDPMFIKMQDGDTVRVVFCGEPVARRIVWDQAAGRSVEFNEQLHQERDGKQRFAFNVYDTGSKQIRIMELNQRTFIDIAKLRRSNGGTLASSLVRVSRKGADKTTIYWVEVEKQLTPEQMQRVETVYSSDKYDLDDVLSGGPQDDGYTAAPVPVAPVPVAPVAAAPVAAAPVPVAPVAAAPVPVAPATNDFDLF